MENQKNESRRSLNVIDIIIIILLIAAIALVVYRYFSISKSSLNDESAAISFEVNSVSSENAAEFISGKILYLSSDDSKIGTFGEITKEHMLVESVLDNGQIVTSENPDRYVIRGTATITGKWSDRGFMLNGTTLISLGSEITVYTDRNTFTLTVVGISE